MIEATLYNRLSTYAGLTALVGTRIYPLIMPQGVTYPALVYQRISTVPRYACMGTDVGLVRTRIQVTAWGDTFAEVKAIANQVRQALQRWNPTGVQDTFIVGEYDLFDETAEKFGAAVDAEVIYEE